MIGANANLMGVAVGFFVPAIFVDQNDINDPDHARTHIFQVLFSVSIASSIIMLLVLLTFQDKPPSKPSLGQNEEELQIRSR